MSALNGQVALVTGGASGIGRATVLALARAGAGVAVVDCDADGAAAVAAEAGTHTRDAVPFTCELADVDAIERVVRAILDRFARIDALVNCAGVTGPEHNVCTFTDETFDYVMNVNLRAPFVLTRAVANHMIERGAGGRIVNLSSSAAFRASMSPAIYAATKAGINGLTRSSAADLGPYGINVNAVAPGVTRTPMVAQSNDDVLQSLCESGPLANLLGRVSEPQDVADVIVFLCRPESRQITGQVINTSAGLVV